MVFLSGSTSLCSLAKQVLFPPKILDAQFGKPHSEVINRWVLRTPDSTLRSTTSMPTTAGFMGLGYFLHAAETTVSHGWLFTQSITLDNIRWSIIFKNFSIVFGFKMSRCQIRLHYLLESVLWCPDLHGRCCWLSQEEDGRPKGRRFWNAVYDGETSFMWCQCVRHAWLQSLSNE